MKVIHSTIFLTNCECSHDEKHEEDSSKDIQLNLFKKNQNAHIKTGQEASACK